MQRQLQSGGGLWALGLWGLLAIALMTGCEGSGSSGFDQVDPRLAQEQTIVAEIDNSNNCANMEGVPLCPIYVVLSETLPAPVKITSALGKQVPCVLDTQDCKYTLSIDLDPGETRKIQFIVAVRYHHPVLSEWKIVSYMQALPSNALMFEGNISFRLSAENDAKVDLAVLAYTDSTQTVPEVETTKLVLVDFKPSVVFVAPQVEVKGSTAS